MGAYFLGIDNGGTMTKAVLFDARGNVIAGESADTPVIVYGGGAFVERDMDKLWEVTAACIKGALAKSRVVDPREIACVGCTGHGKGLYLWGKDGKPAYNGIASTDRRAEDVVARFEASGVAAEAKKLTLGRLLSCQPAALLAWLKQNERNVYNSIKYIFEAKDYIRFRLTGAAYAEQTDYSGTSLMNLHTRSFDPELLRLFGIPEIESCLPELVCSYDSCGAVTPEAAALTGLVAGTQVCGGMFDIDACAIASGVTEPGRICVITGTWSINEYPADAPVAPDTTTLNSLFCVPGKYLIEESSPTSAGNLDWYITNMFPNPHGLSKKELYRSLDAAVDDIPPDHSDAVFLPYLYGTNSAARAQSGFYGLHSGMTAFEAARAVYEGICFGHRLHLERLAAHIPGGLDNVELRLTGGAVNSEVWVKMFADVFGRPVTVVSGKEPGTLGCAMAGAVCTGIYGDYAEAAEHMVNVRTTVAPDLAKTAVYNKKYSLWKEFAGV